MKQELGSEGYVFGKRAWELLRNHRFRKDYRSRLLKILEVSNSDWGIVKQWELYEDMVVRIDWFREDDHQKYMNYIKESKLLNEDNPTIKYRVHAIEKSYSELLMKEISNISVQLNTKRENYGWGGIDYEMEIGDKFANIKFKWWSKAPKQWNAVEDMAKRLIVEFDNLLKHEEYVEAVSFDGKLWLKPTSDIKITKDLFSFLKQFTGFNDYNVIKISEIFKSEKPVLLEKEYDYIRYKNIKKEFDKYGLKAEIEYDM